MKKQDYKIKPCKVCNKDFKPISGNQVACSDECKIINRRTNERSRHNKRKITYARTCPICQVVFKTVDSKRKYCGSAACEQLRIKEKNRRAEARRLAKLRSMTAAKAPLNKERRLYKAAKILSKEGYTLLSQDYVDNHTKLSVKCPEGHLWETSLHSFKDSLNRCYQCYRARNQRTFEEVNAFISIIGYDWVNGEKGVGYTTRSPIIYKCKAGHVSEVLFGTLVAGSRCKKCFDESLKYSFIEVKEYIKSQGFKLLDKEYINSKKYINVKCSQDHVYKTTYNRFRGGDRCKRCAIEKQTTNFSFIKKFFTEQGYSLISTSYVPKKKLEYICPKGHEGSTRWPDFYNNGNRCRKCFTRTSGAEKEVRDFVASLGFRVLDNTRAIITPYELDIYVPDKSLAIEYCGLYWHGDSAGRSKEHLRQKMEMCNEKNIRLITIFEDEYLEKPKVVLSRIKSALGIIDKKIYARKCEVREVSSKDANNMFEKYHLQGRSPSKIYLGLYYKDKLLQVMSFGSLSRTHAGRGGKYIELKRLVSLPDIIVVGGASRLFSAGKKWALTNGYQFIKSYCDMRWANPFNPVYEQLGFELSRETKYTPHYFRGQQRYRNQGLRKTPEERLTGKTEWELRQEQGYDRIWDCGHRTYEYRL